MGESGQTIQNPGPSIPVQSALHEHWRLFLIEGIVLLVLGSAAILVPEVATIAVAICLGWLFLLGGTVALALTFVGRHAPGFPWALISAVITIVTGAAFFGWPIGGAISLTFILTAYLIADGIVTMLFAFEHRRQLSQRWHWLLLNGATDLLLAAIIVWALPSSAVWAVGLIVGIDLVFGGWSLIAMAMAARAPRV